MKFLNSWLSRKTKGKTIVVSSVIFLSLLAPVLVLLVIKNGRNKGFSLPVGLPRATAVLKTPWVVTPVIEGGQGEIQPPEHRTSNCTYTSDYWAAHPEIWRAENILIGERSFSKADAIQALQSSDPSLQARFLKQFLAVALNSLDGADRSAVASILSEASGWLDRNLSLLELPKSESRRGKQLVAILEDYNNGVSGPGLCPDQPATPTPTLTPTPTPTATPVVYSLPPVPVTGKTEAPGDKEGDSGDEPVPTPTPTSPPTNKPTPVPSSTPTQPPKPSDTPQPSNTVQPTATDPPAPSNTPEPTSTSTPQPIHTPKPTHTPKPKQDDKPTKTPKPKKTKKPSKTPKPKKTEKPTKTPKK